MTTKKVKLTDKIRELVVAAYVRDPRPVRIAREFGLHHYTVKRILRKAGVYIGDGESAVENLGGQSSAEAHDVKRLLELIEAVKERYMKILLSASRVRTASPRDAAMAVAALVEHAEREQQLEAECGNTTGLKLWTTSMCRMRDPVGKTGERLQKMIESAGEFKRALEAFADETGIPLEEINEWKWYNCDPEVDVN